LHDLDSALYWGRQQGGAVMLGRQERWQEDLFAAGPLRDLIPNDHILKRVDRVLDRL